MGESRVVATVGLFRSRKTGRLLVQTMSAHPMGGDVALGEPTAVDEVELESKLSSLVDKALADYKRAQWQPELSPRRDRNFRDNHSYLCVNALDDGRLELIPATREEGGFHGSRVNVMYVAAGTADAALVATIREAFNRIA